MSNADKIRESDDFELNDDQSDGHKMVLYRSDRYNQDQILVEPKLPMASPAVMKRAKAFTAEHKLSASGEYDQKLEELSAEDPDVYGYLIEMKQYVRDLDEYEKLRRRMRRNVAGTIDTVFETVRKAVDNNMKRSAGKIGDILDDERKKASGE